MRKNIFIYISSLIFAIILWMYINLNLVYNISVSIPLDIKLSKVQAIASDLPNTVDVSIKGKGWDLLGVVLSKNLKLNLDLTNYKKDTKINIAQSVNELLSLSSNVLILAVNPDVIEINFDNITSKTVKVKNLVNVVPKNGYIIIGAPKVNPDSVKISGAISVIGKIKFLPTEQINILNVNSGFTKTINIIDTLNNIVKIEPKSVTVTYDIELSAEKNYEDINVLISNVPQDKEVLLIPPKLKIYLRGGVEQLAKINPEEIFAGIEYKQIENDSLGYVSPKISLPVDVTVIKYEPQKFQYIIKKKNVDNK
ncbi:MAG: CdaR family protein [Ignavibacteriae bacterium]|nr:CdaR family protein [Ignavibacteriota bacterium]